MSLTARSVRNEVQNILDYLVRSEIALFVNPATERDGRVSWSGAFRTELLPYRGSPSIREYRHWVVTRAYSAVLSDGALLQISYECAYGELVGHRLAYVPCPFEVDWDLLQRDPLDDVFELYASEAPDSIVLRSAIRFDFDLQHRDEKHPSVHVSLNAEHCRVACVAPVRIGRFVRFVFRQFYPEMWGQHAYLRELPVSGWGERTVTDYEARDLHLAWPV